MLWRREDSVSRMSIQVSSFGWLAWKEKSTRVPLACWMDVGGTVKLGEDELPGVEVAAAAARRDGSEFVRLCLVDRCFTKSVGFFFRI